MFDSVSLCPLRYRFWVPPHDSGNIKAGLEPGRHDSGRPIDIRPSSTLSTTITPLLFIQPRPYAAARRP